MKRTFLLRAGWALCAAALVCAFAGCGRKEDKAVALSAAKTEAPAHAFRVIAGSELKDVEREFKADIEKATGVELAIVYSGTLDAIDRLSAGEAFDGVWVSHGKYIAMSPSLKNRKPLS